MSDRACDDCGKIGGRLFEDGRTFRCRYCPPVPLFEEAPPGEPYVLIEVTGLKPIRKEDRRPRRKEAGECREWR